ncbi:MAG TPA: SDR family NAD(P)-dependent oxidoreductase [Planctomycetota bacterium]|nr:SDR family NAD(P)-dependent oxidoreductase [Planctomycetota bacterium]
MTRPLAILTGASSGIGAALAPRLARDGWDLVLVARRESLLQDLAARIAREVPGARAEAFALDLLAPGAAAKLVERAPAAKLVVNNAGFGVFQRALEADDETYRRMIALNSTVLCDVTLAFARRMAAGGGGTVFNVASTAAFQAMPFASVYAATKSFVVSMSEGLDFELRDRGVRVLSFCPGPTETEFIQVAGVSAEQAAKGKAFFQSADAVAESAARAIRRGKETAIPGFLNNVLYYATKLFPRKLVRWFTGVMFKPPAPKGPGAG